MLKFADIFESHLINLLAEVFADLITQFLQKTEVVFAFKKHFSLLLKSIIAICQSADIVDAFSVKFNFVFLSRFQLFILVLFGVQFRPIAFEFPVFSELFFVICLQSSAFGKFDFRLQLQEGIWGKFI